MHPSQHTYAAVQRSWNRNKPQVSRPSGGAEGEGSVKELTDEQYAQIYQEALKGYSRLIGNHAQSAVAGGRAVVEAVAPILLAEASEGDFTIAYDNAMRDPKPLGNFRGGWDAAVRFYTNRLARLTAKPDAAIEAVSKMLRDRAQDGTFDEYAAKIVQVVDAARNAGK
jgi:hypothetical protein